MISGRRRYHSKQCLQFMLFMFFYQSLTVKELISTFVEKDNLSLKQHVFLCEHIKHVVDWSKAMVPQIANIAEHYNEWVHKPVDRTIRLFDQWYLEMCTKTPWWIIPLFWVPVSMSFIWEEFVSSWTENNSTKLLFLTLYFITGIFFWTFLEYSLHRWVFHFETNGNTWLCTLHFLIHGLHHKVPFDSHRLVFPPIPGVIIASILYTPIYFLTTHSRIVMGGGIFGYICYDLMHYYLHYGNPTSKHMYHMKRYHFQHHFAHQKMGFGISSPLWDFVFSTRIQLRTLRYQLMWR